MNSAAHADLGLSALPALWVAGAVAGSAVLAAVSLRSHVARNLMLAVAATFAGLGGAEVGAWRWFTSESMPPSSIGRDEPRAPSGILLHPIILPSKSRMPAVRGSRPRVLFIGDSFTEGLGVAARDNFAALVGQALDAGVINHGVAGTDTREQHLLWHYYSKTWEPDVVVWVFVLNDFFPRIPLGPDYLMRYEPRPVLGSYLLGMVRVVVARRAVQALTIEAYQQSLDPATNPESFASLEGVLKEVHADVAQHGGRLVVMIFPLMWELERYPFTAGHDHVAAVAARAGAEVIDLLPEFRHEDAPDLWVSKFDHHPNQRGRALAARRLTDTLRAGQLVAMPARQPPPVPAQWLGAARAVYADDGTTLHGLRVAMTLATAAARLAELEGGPDSTAFSEQALSFARQCQNDMTNRWRPVPAPSSG